MSFLLRPGTFANGGEPQALTDVFAITCEPNRSAPGRHGCDQPESWSGEVRLTVRRQDGRPIKIF